MSKARHPHKRMLEANPWLTGISEERNISNATAKAHERNDAKTEEQL